MAASATTGRALRYAETPRAASYTTNWGTTEAGDLVETLDRGPRPILWAGSRRLSGKMLAADPRLRPIRIRKGAVGNRRDLVLSPQHAVMTTVGGREVLVRAKHLEGLLGGAARVARGKKTVEYVHLLLPRHEILIAEDAPCESLYPGAFALGGLEAAARDEIFALFPQLRDRLAGGDADGARRVYGPLARPMLTGGDIRRLKAGAPPLGRAA